MATFHPFLRLPLELRITIWALATEDRLLRVYINWSRNGHYCSPTWAPSVTRSCRESREHCSYQKAFIVDSSPHYIWVNFDRDVIQMTDLRSIEEIFPERDRIKHLRILLEDDDGFDESDIFYFMSSEIIPTLSKLESFDLLVANMGQRPCFIKDTNWGTCPNGNVRIVDAKTGAWIDKETSDPYWDYLDSDGEHYDQFTRELYDWEDEDGRIEAMKRLQMPRSCIDVNRP